MTVPAIHFFVLSIQFKIGFAMIKPGAIRTRRFPKGSINPPTLRCMALSTIDFERSPVRVLRKEACRK
jgi:hypothetical protein